MTVPSRVVIVGASAAGLGAADGLRRRGYDGRIDLLDAQPHLPYERPPLSKQFLTGAWTADQLVVHPIEHYRESEIGLRLGATVTAVDPEAGSVEVVRAADGARERIDFDCLIVATGLRARRGDLWQEDMPGLHVLRELDDAVALQQSLAAGSRLVVVGAGFLGTEIAGVARGLGLDVTVVCPEARPLQGQVGADLAHRLLGRHADEGVRLRAGVPIERILGSAQGVTGVLLADGSRYDADVVLLSIGAEVESGLLRDSGLPLDGGVLVDSSCRAAPGLWAVGDVANRFDRVRTRHSRTEHRMTAAEHGVAAAESILGMSERAPQPGYFWTDQYDVRIQACGTVGGALESRLVEVDDDGQPTVVEFAEDGQVVGIAAWNSPRAFAQHRRDLAVATSSRLEAQVV